jgi:hypothetical protein
MNPLLYRDLTWKMEEQNNKGLMWFKVKFYKGTSAFADDLDVFVNTE